MSIFTSIATGFSKAASFLITIFTKTKQVEDVLVSLAPQTKAAILATFYDVSKTVMAAEGAAGAAASGDIPTAFTLSETTLMLIKSVITDAKNDASIIAADLKALGVLASPPAA